MVTVVELQWLVANLGFVERAVFQVIYLLPDGPFYIYKRISLNCYLQWDIFS
jgi:hypothetical protein